MVDSRDAMRSGGQSGPTIDFRNPNKSLLIQALRHDGIEMPPVGPLPENVVNDFVRWVKAGAADPRVERNVPPKVALEPGALWSFTPPISPPIPDTDGSSWPVDSIDHFVLSKLHDENLSPVHAASPRSLIRRLYFDLIGLPPTFEQIDSFAKEHSHDARSATRRLVDRLLASPEFGRRWGRHWLDIARYGESNGDDGLGRNATFPHAWRYRDWVIDAVNADVRYDDFLKQQIAGDLLPADNAAERNSNLTATGFLAIGSKPAAAMNKDFAMDVVDDQISTVCTAVIGLSVGCARCHDHKHDPIPTRDYYALAGIFKSTETLYGLAANEKLTAPPTPLHELVDEWLPNQPKIDRRAVPKFPSNYADAIERLGPQVYESLQAKPSALNIARKSDVTFSQDKFATLKQTGLVGKLPTPGADYSVSFWIRNSLANNKQPITAYPFSRAKISDGKLPGDHLGIGGTHDKSRTGKLFVFNGNTKKQSIPGTTKIPQGTWNHVVLIRQGDRVRVYLNGVIEIDAELAATFGDNTEFVFGRRSEGFAPLQGNLAHVAVFDRALSDAEAVSLHEKSDQPKGRKTSSSLAMGVRDKAKPADCKIHVNGTGSKLGPAVPRGFLTAYQTVSTKPAVSSQPAIEPRRSGRLELANWLTQPDHPQTSRVAVNRVWQRLFGRGIVTTVDDFGVYGSRPSHPELLDHLATEFVKQGWSLKRLIRKLVLSRTYQLDSYLDQSLIESDPDNVFLARHQRSRLDAESLRDSILQVSGHLDRRPADGSPIQTTNILINWPPGEATNLHRPSNRRSIYLCMLRHAPPPELAAFDLPDGVQVKGQRDLTLLPTQTLFLLNSEFVVDQSLRFAKRILRDGDTDKDRVQRIFRDALQRMPTAIELDSAIAHVRSVRQAMDRGTPQRDLYSWASLCQAILGTNEFRYVD